MKTFLILITLLMVGCKESNTTTTCNAGYHVPIDGCTFIHDNYEDLDIYYE